MEFGSDISPGEGTILRPRLKLGVTRFLIDADPQVDASFVYDSGSHTTRTELDKTYFNAELAEELFTSRNVIVSLDATGRFAYDTYIYGGKLRIAIAI